MAERAASVPYTPYSTVESGGGGGTPMGVRANPEDFGGQVGAAVEKGGQQAFDLAMKQQGMINESLATNADAELAKTRGDIKAKYLALSGQEAYAAYPQYQADLQAAQTRIGSTLSGNAKRAYDLMSIRATASDIAEGGAHAAQQVKQAQIDAGSNLANTKVQELLYPSNAANPDRVSEIKGDIKHAVGMMIDPDHPGFVINQETGQTTFADTPEGQQLKETYQRNLDAYLGQAQINRFNTLAKQDPIAAQKTFEAEKDGIPKLAQIHIEASLQPQVFNANVKGTTSTVLTEASQQHYQMLTNPSSSGSSAYNLGNVKTAEGARNNTQDFVQPATPVDGVILTANNLRSKNYEGKTLSEIGHTWTSTDKEAWVKNVSAVSGISPDSVPNLNDPKQLSALLKGIAAAEKSPSDRANFTDDVIAQGVTASLAGQQPKTSMAQPKSYATNPDGSPLTQADYYKTHSAEVYARGDTYAEQTMPGNLQFKHAVRASLEQGMSTAIRNQEAQYVQDKNFIMRAFNGDFTNGKHPTSLDELSAIPNVKDVLDRASVHSPDFVRMLDQRLLTAASRGDEVKGNGPAALEVANKIANGEITGESQIQEYLTDQRLSFKGYGEMVKLLKDSPGAKAQTSAYNDIHKLVSLQTKDFNDPKGEALWASAMPILDKQLAENREKKIPDYKSYDPTDKDYIGNAVKPLIRSPAQKVADKRAAALAAAQAHEGDDIVQLAQLRGKLSRGELKGTNGAKAIRDAVKNKTISLQTGTQLGIDYGYIAPPQESNTAAAVPVSLTVPRPE